VDCTQQAQELRGAVVHSEECTARVRKQLEELRLRMKVDDGSAMALAAENCELTTQVRQMDMPMMMRISPSSQRVREIAYGGGEVASHTKIPTPSSRPFDLLGVLDPPPAVHLVFLRVRIPPQPPEGSGGVLRRGLGPPPPAAHMGGKIFLTETGLGWLNSAP
jgi:hypothetical protein